MECEKKIWVVIPAYNEEKMIGAVIADVLRYASHVLVMDDNSYDGTAAQARNAGAVVLSHSINLGQGAALQTGTEYALSKGADIIVHFDADGQLMADDIPAIIEPIVEDRSNVALGSRFLGSHNAPFLRKVFLKVAILFTWFFSGIKLTDTHNGFRAFSRKAAEKIHIRENRMAHASEILHEIARQRLSFTEVPVTVRYTDYSRGRGEGSLRRSIHVMYRLLRRRLFI